MKTSKLSEHKFEKGQFYTTWGEFINGYTTDVSWFKDRMPLYIWLALIIDFYGHTLGLEKCEKLIKKLVSINDKIDILKFSEILTLSEEEQNDFFEYCVLEIDREVLNPLTVLYTSSSSKSFSKFFFIEEERVEDRIDKIIKILEKCSDHQSNISTDMRFLILFTLNQTGKLIITQNDLIFLKALEEYAYLSHENEEMALYRSNIRASEIAMSMIEGNDVNFIEEFWEKISLMTNCELFKVEYKKDDIEKKVYLEILYEVITYLSRLFSEVDPLNNKMLVLIGMTTYAYKRVCEVGENNLENTIISRGTVRVLVESYIMMKYLLLLENTKADKDVWKDFQLYGMGQYKLIYERYDEFYVASETEEMKASHVNYKYIDLLVKEFKDKELIGMDTSYFDKKNVREKARSIGEKRLFDLYYDYDSVYEHGLWGAIRESSLLPCSNPAHQYHLVPDSNSQQNMKSTWYDCVQIMNKTLFLINDLFGIPSDLITELVNYEDECLR